MKDWFECRSGGMRQIDMAFETEIVKEIDTLSGVGVLCIERRRFNTRV
jgi:hypothetical protein